MLQEEEEKEEGNLALDAWKPIKVAWLNHSWIPRQTAVVDDMATLCVTRPITNDFFIIYLLIDIYTAAHAQNSSPCMFSPVQFLYQNASSTSTSHILNTVSITYRFHSFFCFVMQQKMPTNRQSVGTTYRSRGSETSNVVDYFFLRQKPLLWNYAREK